MSRLLPPLLCCAMVGCTCACGPDRASMKSCGDRVYLQDGAASCELALERVELAKRIVTAAGLEVVDVDVVFAPADQFVSPGSGDTAEGFAGIGYVMVGADGAGLVHEYIHQARGPNHFGWERTGWLGLDHLAWSLTTGELAEVDRLCEWEVPTPAQVEGLRDAGVPVDEWLQKLQRAQRNRPCGVAPR